MKFLGMIIIAASFWGCQTTAPSNYELNRRSGIPVAIDNGDDSTEPENVDKELSKIRNGTGLSKTARMPVRLPGIVEKVWVFGHRVNEKHWIQGTWVFVEVDQEKWLGEIDTGEGEFTSTEKEEK